MKRTEKKINIEHERLLLTANDVHFREFYFKNTLNQSKTICVRYFVIY